MTVYALRVLFILLLAEIAGGILRSPYLSWNEVRLCRSMELLRGLPLYPGKDGLGPIVGTLHTPVSHFFYEPAAMLPDPTSALAAASTLAVLAVLLPLAWVFFKAFKAAPSSALGVPCFLYSAFLIVQAPGTYNVLFMIHADAPAVGLATLACGLVLSPGGPRQYRYWLAGCACAMSLAAKQTMAPVVVAIAVFLFFVDGARPALHFICAAACAGILLLAIMFSIWPARDVLFNIWTLAASRPMKPQPLQVLLSAYRSSRLDSLPALLPVLFIGVSSRKLGIRSFVLANRWIVFLLCSVCMLPVSLKALVSIGSDINHLGVVLYFLFVAAGLAIQQHMHARLFLVVGILVSLAPGLALAAFTGVANLRNNPAQLAAAYDHNHPGRAYFPWDPAASIRDDGLFHHLDPALFDREQVGFALTPQQLQSGLPKQFTLVALPPGERLMSRALLDLTANYRLVIDPELPGWTVLASPQ